MTVELADSYESLFNRAIEQAKLGNTPGAIDLFQRIVNRLSKLGPKTLRRPECNGMLLMALVFYTDFMRWEEQLDQAVALCEHVFALHPELDTVNFLLNRLYIEQGRIEEGLTGLRQTAECLNKADGWITLGIQLVEFGQNEQAEACYKKALACAQNNREAADVHFNLFKLYQIQQRVDEALEAWSTAVVLSPEIEEHKPTLYRWLIQTNQAERVRPFLQRERNPLWREFYGGLLAWHSGQVDAARRHWQAVFESEIDEQDFPPSEWLEAALRLGHADQILDRFAWIAEYKAAPHEDIASDPFFLSGLACAIQGDLQTMHRHMQSAIKILKQDWPSRSKIAGCRSLVTDLISDPETLAALGEYLEYDEDRV